LRQELIQKYLGESIKKLRESAKVVQWFFQVSQPKVLVTFFSPSLYQALQGGLNLN
jgi:hypothetical protein